MGWTGVLRALAVSLALILMTAEAPVLHQHSGDAPALYDDVCPLSQLSAGGNEVGLARPLELTQPFTAIGLVGLPASAGGSTRSVLPFEPRGPPSAA
jgi:hypothetical protein